MEKKKGVITTRSPFFGVEMGGGGGGENFSVYSSSLALFSRFQWTISQD